MNDRSDDKTQPTHEEIALRAYELYCEHGCEEGHDVEHWLQAETELTQESPELQRSATDGATQ